jgi:hypothetical protein
MTLQCGELIDMAMRLIPDNTSESTAGTFLARAAYRN